MNILEVLVEAAYTKVMRTTLWEKVIKIAHVMRHSKYVRFQPTGGDPKN